MNPVTLRTLDGKVDPAVHDDLKDLARVLNDVHADVQAHREQLQNTPSVQTTEALRQRTADLEQQVAVLVKQVKSLLP